MSDFNPFAQVSSFFFPNEQGTNLKLREKIALAQMMRKQAYPKTLGEGFASIGDSISDVITARGLEKSDREAQAVAAKLGAPREAGAITPVSSAPTIAEPSPVQAAAIAGGQDPTSQVPVPPSVQEGGPPPPPGPMFRPNLRTSTVMTPAAPAVPAPPDVPGAIRLSTQKQLDDFRTQNPLPQNIPPPPVAPPTTPQRPSVADFGQKLALAPTPPPGGQPVTPSEDPRREIALTMLRQGQTKQPPVSPRPPAPAPQGVEVAPPDALQRIAQAQPQAIPGYVPPELADPTRADVIPPSKRERELQLILNANQGNPYAVTSSPAAMELRDLQTDRAKQQDLADKKTEAAIARTTKRMEQTEAGKMDQAQREATVAETRQKLIDYGQTRAPAPGAGPDPRLGTPASPQRTGIPTPEPMHPGAIPVEWAKDQQKKISSAQDGLEATRPELTESLDLMTKIRTHPGKARSIGFLGGIGQLTPEGQGFSALDTQLKGKNLVAAYQKIKGTGPVGEKEGENIAKAQAALTTASTERDYNTALDTLETTLRGAVERVERKLNRPVTAYQNTPDDPYAPDLNQRGFRTMPTSNGKKVEVEYVGGDPDKDSSYKTVRR